MNQFIVLEGKNDPNLDIYRQKDQELLHLCEPDPGLFIAESPLVLERALQAGYQPLSALVDRKQMTEETIAVLGKCGDIPVYTAEEDVLVSITGFKLTRGLLCAMKRHTLPTVQEVLQDASRIAVLEEVENPTNIGALFRSAAALFIDAVLLTPGCADPLYRRAIRVSMGNVFSVPWTFIGKKSRDWPDTGMQLLHDAGFRTAAFALSDHSVSVDDPKLKAEERLAIVLGTEGDGLKKQTIASCDYTVKIPMKEGIDSLNVAAAGAVAFWEIGKR